MMNNKYNYCIVNDKLYYLASVCENFYLGIDVLTGNNVGVGLAYDTVKVYEHLDLTGIKNLNTHTLLDIRSKTPIFTNIMSFYTWYDFKFNDNLVPYIFKSALKLDVDDVGIVLTKLVQLLSTHVKDIRIYKLYPYIVEIKDIEYSYHLYLKVCND